MTEAGVKIGFNKDYDLFKIAWPEQGPVIVSQAEISADYEKCYQRKGVKA